jgi:hypothetical protein
VILLWRAVVTSRGEDTSAPQRGAIGQLGSVSTRAAADGGFAWFYSAPNYGGSQDSIYKTEEDTIFTDVVIDA